MRLNSLFSTHSSRYIYPKKPEGGAARSFGTFIYTGHHGATGILDNFEIVLEGATWKVEKNEYSIRSHKKNA